MPVSPTKLVQVSSSSQPDRQDSQTLQSLICKPTPICIDHAHPRITEPHSPTNRFPYSRFVKESYYLEGTLPPPPVGTTSFPGKETKKIYIFLIVDSSSRAYRWEVGAKTLLDETMCRDEKKKKKATYQDSDRMTVLLWWELHTRSLLPYSTA